MEKQPSPAQPGGLLGLGPAKLDSVYVSHRQQGVWAGGWGPRAVQLGSGSVHAGLGPLELASACTLGGGCA